MLKFQRLMKILICAGFLSVFAGCASTTTSKTTTPGQYVDDSIVTTRVKAAIFDDLALKGFQINVKTYQGIVQLSGFVDTAEHARMAGDIARKVEGVKDVRNDLIVK